MNALLNKQYMSILLHVHEYVLYLNDLLWILKTD